MITMEKEDLYDQKGMERAFQQYFERVKQECGDTLNAMLNVHFHTCDYEKQSLVLCLETKHWMTNPGGILHGGVIASCFDLTMGILCRYFAGGHMTPTINLNVNYLRSGPAQGNIFVMAEITHKGSTICGAIAKLWGEGAQDCLLATASGSYYIVNHS